MSKKKITVTVGSYERRYVKLTYDGSDLKGGRVGPQELKGTLTRVGQYTSDLDTGTEVHELITNDIKIDSIEIIEVLETVGCIIKII